MGALNFIFHNSAAGLYRYTDQLNNKVVSSTPYHDWNLNSQPHW